jgi:hypothetical protein
MFRPRVPSSVRGTSFPRRWRDSSRATAAWWAIRFRPTSYPDVPADVIAYTDGYGNLKTTQQDPPAENGERVLVRVGHAATTAIVSDGSFSVAEGELALAPGTSGWALPDGSERRFIELFLRGGSAAARLGHPTSGTPVVVMRIF